MYLNHSIYCFTAEEKIMSKNTQLAILDSETKRQRVRGYIESKNLDGVVITTREHFAWITSGGDNHVVYPTNIGFGAVGLVQTRYFRGRKMYIWTL
jgi:hypothetical protein